MALEVGGAKGMAERKALTPNNFLLPDPQPGRAPEAGGREFRSAVDWAHDILAVELAGGVPEGIRGRFEIARGILLYGFFWYPFWAEGTAVAVRAVEAALEDACGRLGAPKRAKTAEARVGWLSKRGVLEGGDGERWEELRGRLEGAATVAPPVTPDDALEALRWIADLIGRLSASKE